jgi:hypothetical protein
METTTYVPVKKKQRKRISKKKSLYEVLKPFLPEREPVGLNFHERKFIQRVGYQVGKAYREKYGEKAETAERTEYWLLGGKKNRKAIPRENTVNLYPAAFLREVIRIVKEEAEKDDKVKLL